MNAPVPFSEVIGCLHEVAARFDRGEATRQELQDALVQLEGAKRVVSEALIEVAK
jgi:hypothetical protein